MSYSQSTLAEKERRMAEQASSGRAARDHLHDRFDQRANVQPTASIHAIHSFGRKDDQVASSRPPLRRRIFRALIRFVVTILFGVGGTLAWQSYGDVARQMAVARVPALNGLLSVSPTMSHVLAVSASPAQQGGSSASSPDALRRGMEQLAARQEQMAQNIATLQAIGEDIRQKMSFTPPSVPAALVQPAAPIVQHKPALRTQSSPALPR
jgi:hypothetical protein